MKFRNPFQSAIKRNFMKEAELRLYEKVAKDIENNDINNGVWTKAFAKSNGDVAKQKSIYIELMVELYEDRLRAEEELEVILASAANKDKADQQEDELRKKEVAARKQRLEEEEKYRIQAHERWLADAPQREIEDLKNKKMAWFGFAFMIITVLGLVVSVSFR
jgi:hypothetical protein